MAIRVVGITQGAASDPLASSGLNRTVFGTLARQVDLVRVLDLSMRGWQKIWNALSNWRPNRNHWRERFDLNVWAFRHLSREAGEMLAELDGKFDVAFQLRTMYTPGDPPGRWPYVMLVDNTYTLSDRYYRPWAPMNSRDTQRWLALEREAYHRAHAVFARTAWVRRSLIEDYGLPEEKAVYTGTGCNYDVGVLPKEKVTDDGRTLLFVGKDFERKGVPTLLEAFKKVRQQQPSARLLLLGSAAKIDQPGVEVLGKVYDRDHLSKIYERTSIFVLPSHFEPCANVVVEAMAFHLPCIVTSVGGVSDLVGDGQAGFVVQPGNADQLAGRILDLMSDAGLRQSMGKTGVQRVREELNWERVIERMLPYLESANQSAPLQG